MSLGLIAYCPSCHKEQLGKHSGNAFVIANKDMLSLVQLGHRNWAGSEHALIHTLVEIAGEVPIELKSSLVFKPLPTSSVLLGKVS